MDKKKGTSKAPPVSGFLARFRGLLQACAVLLTNPHLPNLFKGQIYRGKGKTVCVPGLNCYSCPAATGACPIGAIQSVIGSSKFKFSYYVTGTLILLGVLLGRVVCGFLCPFGWFQELIHKIPLPRKKLSTKKLRPLRYLKYLILLLTVTLPLILPGVLSGTLLAFALSMDDFVISFFVSGPGTTTLPVKIYSSVRMGVSLQVNALSTLMLATVFLLMAAFRLSRRARAAQSA